MSALEKCQSFKVVNDYQIADDFLAYITTEYQNSIWIRDPDGVGDIAICFYDKYPDKLAEVVFANNKEEGGSIITIFERNPLFMQHGELQKIRKELIYDIAEITKALPSKVFIKDEGRRRDVYLNEMSTMQLADIVMQSKTGNVVVNK